MVFSKLFGKKKEEKKTTEPTSDDRGEELYRAYLEDHSMSKAFFDMTLNEFLGRKIYQYDADEKNPHRFLLTIGIDRETEMSKVVLGGANWTPFIFGFVDSQLHRRVHFTDKSSHLPIRTLVYFTSYDFDEQIMRRLFNMPDPAIYEDEAFHEAKEVAKSVPIFFSEHLRNYGVTHLFPSSLRAVDVDVIKITLDNYIVEIPDSVPVRAFGEVLRRGKLRFEDFYKMLFEDCTNWLREEFPEFQNVDSFYFEASVEYAVLMLTLLTELGVTNFGEKEMNAFFDRVDKLSKKYKL
ncbi:hypothetical protein [Archaeoglobus neptunius]|uniref:hypothetical protein n=1 Tax=Archaeoglobus neptunius TaxID=2798580 RepID=UPI00192614E1|nr:hypothetical protein [Archaeoglobus neptunius]